MAEFEIECSECGWRGMASALEEQAGKSGGEPLRFCPDCGGTHFENLAEKEQEEDS